MEYVDNKLIIYRDDPSLKIVKVTQPILVHKLWEEYWPMEGSAS